MAVRTNLVTNPSFEVNTTGWLPAGSRANAVPEGIHSGAWYMAFPGANAYKTQKVAATAGLPYTASAYFNRSVASRSAAVSIHFYDASSVELDAPTVTLTSITTLNVPERRTDTRTAPTGTTQIEVWVHGSNANVQVDGVLLEQSATVGTYFDGSTVANGYSFAWTGTAHASASTATFTGRTNLLLNPSFEVDGTTGWVNGSRSNASSSPTISGAWNSTVSSTTSTIKQAATAGLPYTASGWFTRTGSARSVAIGIRFYDAADAELDPPTLTQTSVVTANVPERRSMTRTAPTGTTQVSVVFSCSSVLNMDAIMLEQASSVRDYFDGSTTLAGHDCAWTGTAHASTSTATENGSPYISQVYSANNLTAANPTIVVTDTPPTGSTLILLVGANQLDNAPTAVSGCGATWTRVISSSAQVLDAWIGTGATSAGTVTTTAAAFPRAMALYVLGGVDSTAAGVTHFQVNNVTSPAQDAGAGQIVIGFTFSDTSANAITALVPATGWTEPTPLAMSTSTRFSGLVHRVPATTESHTTSAARSGNAYVIQLVVGTVGEAPLESGVSTEATVTTTLSTHRTLSTAVGVETTAATVLGAHHVLETPADTEVTVTTSLISGGAIDVPVDVEVTTATTALTAHHTLATPVGVDSTITTALSAHQSLSVPVSVTGTVTTVLETDEPESLGAAVGLNISVYTKLVTNPRISVPVLVEVITFTELGYVVKPAELGTGPLGKRINYNVGTSAVPLNPAEGSGSTPSINAAYIKGIDPELALGERNVLTTGNIGTYEGEIVNLTVNRSSATVGVSMSTPLTLLSNELALFPFIDSSASTWTAARAIDYWTQQCGLFYDKVPGEVIAYASAYGHNNAYGASTSSHFYERLTGGTTATSVVNERSVKTLGSAVTGTTAFHEDIEASVPLTVLKNRKLIFSIGLGIRGTDRTATVNWNFLDPQDAVHVLSISATSAGLITATVDGITVGSTSVSPNGDYRIAASLEPVGSALVAKLTVHTDDLAGNGTVSYASTAVALAYNLPTSLRLKSLEHISAGGSGTQMLRWGSYLTIDNKHPDTVPAVQKALEQSATARGFVSGFEGNVWNLLNEFCSIARLDVRFIGEQLAVGPRITTLTAPGGNFSEFSYTVERRDKYKQVAVVNLQSRADTTDTAVLWRADSVFTVAAREVFETTVQTDHSILNVVQPVPVTGILPFPYKVGGGQYVVTGADGYIIEPAWWNDNGGLVEVSLTGKVGEIAIKITAPAIDTVRAPYRISEGEADRPALYISGSGILNTPKEVHVGTGARNAKEGFDNVFESPFLAGVVETYDTAMAMASEYSAMNAEVDFEIPNDFDTPSRFGQFPAGTIFTDNVRNYRIQNASQTHSKVSGSAVAYTTIGAYVASLPEGATIADANARNFGATIRQFNIKPLRGTSV